MTRTNSKHLLDLKTVAAPLEVKLASSASISTAAETHEANMMLVSGRGRIGKTTFLRGVASLAIMAGRPVGLCDFDRSNASLSKYYTEAQMLTTAAQLPMERRIEQVLGAFLQDRKGYGLDIGGNDKTFENFLAQGNISRLLEKHDKYLTWCQVFSTDEEDVAYFRTAYDALASQKRIQWVMCLSYASALEGDEVEQFAPVREHPVIERVLDAGGELVGIPKLAINADVVKLRLRYEDAVANKPGPKGERIGDWNASRVETWLESLRVAVERIEGWLP